MSDYPHTKNVGSGGLKDLGPFALVNKSTGLTLDGNSTSGTCSDQTYPRGFMFPRDVTADNQYFTLKDFTVGTVIYYQIINYLTGKAYDGDTSVPQTDSTHPMPFFATPDSSKLTQQWKFEQISYGVFVIVNRSNLKALDGNVSGATQPCASRPSPFLWTLDESALNHQWLLAHRPTKDDDHSHHHHHHHHHNETDKENHQDNHHHHHHHHHHDNENHHH